MAKGKVKLTQKGAENSPAGGVVVGERNGQTMIYDDASVGGYFVGKTHSKGGIKMVNKSSGQQLEVQGSEIIITAPAVADQTKNEFNGKMMTNREILSAINEKGGGVSFAKGGDIPKNIKRTGASYKYGGKTMTDHEIYKHITRKNNLSNLVRDAKSGNTPARDLNNYNDVIDVNADGEVGGDTGVFDDGGIVKEAVEYITIANYSDSPFRDIQKVKFYNFIDFKIFIKDLYASEGATNKRSIYLCINNDDSTSRFRIYTSEGKNTNSNFNPFTGTFTDLVKSLKKYSEYRYNEYDWNRWGGIKTTTTTKSRTVKNNQLTKSDLINKKIWIGDNLSLRDRVIKKLEEVGLPMDTSMGDKDLLATENINIIVYNRGFVVLTDKKIDFDGIITKKELFESDLFPTSTTSTTTSSGKFSSGQIDAFKTVDKIVDINSIEIVSITEWSADKITKDFDVVDTLTGEIFKLRKYNKSLGCQDRDIDKLKAQAFIKDYQEWKKTQTSGTTTASTSTPVVTPISAPFNLTKTKIWIGDNPTLSKRIQEKAIELGWDWWSGSKTPANLDYDNIFFDVNGKITSASDRANFDSFSDFKEIFIADLFPTSTASQTNTLEDEMKNFGFSTIFPDENIDWVKKFTADLDKLDTYLPNDKNFAPELSKEQKDLNSLIKLLPSFQKSKYAVERAKILNEIKKLHYKLTYEGFIKPNEASAVSTDLFTPQGLLDYYFTQATQNPTAELEPACELPTPNGEKSKLPMSAYLNVRTPQFKNWFGDWEKAYENSNYIDCSKMIDPDTKEPKIYFHGVRKYVPNFGQFSNMGQGVVRPYGAFEPPSFPASYFAGEEDYAKFYGGVAENMPTPSPDYKPFIYKVFLSVKNPISLLPLDFMLSYKDFLDYIYVGYGVKVEPNAELLKLLNNDMNDKKPMWLYVRRDIGFIEKLKDYGYDALFQMGDIPTFLPDGTVEPDRTKHLQEVEYLTFKPSQVKSATVKKSFYFDFFNDIRFKNGGYVCI